MRVPIAIVGGTAESAIPRINLQRTINLKPQLEGEGAEAPMTLRHTPGLKRGPAVGAGPLRSPLITWRGYIFGVWGAQLVRVDNAGNHTVIGTLNGTRRVVFAWTVRELCCVDGANYVYSYQPENATTFTATSLGSIATINPTSIAQKDFRFYVNRTSGNDEEKGYFYESALLNGRTWSGSNKNAEAQADGIQALIGTSNNIIAVGEWSSQHYFNPGDSTATFALDPARGQDIGWGTPAPYSVAQIEDTIVFLGQMMNGGMRVVMHPGGPISDPDLDNAIAQMQTVSDAFGFVYAEGPNYLYQLTFPSEDRTFVWPFKEKKWFEKQSKGYGRHLATGAVQLGGKTYVGLETNGYLYEWDDATYTDDGDTIFRERTLPVVFSPDGSEVFVENLRLNLAPGRQALDVDARIMVDLSGDGGHTFDNEMTLDCGEHGDYRKIVETGRMGQFGPEVILRLRMTNPAPWAIISASAELSKGDF